MEFTGSIKFIMAFLFLTLMLSMFTSQKFTYMFLVLVFLGMLITNSNKINQLLGGLRYE